MRVTIEKRHRVGAYFDRYGIKLTNWLGRDQLTGAVFTPPVDSGLTISDVDWSDDVVSALITAEAVGTFDIDVLYIAGDRRDHSTMVLTVTE